MKEIEMYCSAKRGSVLEYPFGPASMVMKVGGKMFALIGGGEAGESISLKCDPVIAVNLREQYEAVVPGYHLNKKHWNTVRLNGSISCDELCSMIDHSYELVVRALSKAEREKLLQL
jgi:predicted DNA-binding protein (MmcQ/YjbR family)